MIVFSIDDIEVQLTKEQADIFNPVARKSDKSLPVEIASTPEMDELFSNAFEINGTIRDGIDWNPNHKASCLLTGPDGVTLLKGYAQLTNINTVGSKITYQVLLFGKIKDIMTEVGEKLLIGNDDTAEDLDFSEYTHTYDLATAERSWEFDCDVNSVATDLTGNGKGYLYPLIDVGTSPDLKKYFFQDFKPAFYWREILYKIFDSINVRWQSDFLDSEFFKRLVFPFMGEQLKMLDADMTNQSASATRITSAQEVSFYNTPVGGSGPDRSTGEIIILNNETADPSSQYNASTGEFTALDNGEFILEGQMSAYIKYVGSLRLYPHNPSFDHYGNIVFEVVKDSGGGSYTPLATFECRTFFNNLTQVGGDDELPTNTTTDKITGEGKFQTQPFTLLAGEKVYIKPYYYRDDYFGAWYSQALCYVDVNSFVNINRTSSIVSGQSIDPTLALPNLKQKDFLEMVIKRFNLRLDPVDENIVVIEPENDFYLSDTQNWEEFRATDKDLIFYPMSLLDAKQYEFNHEKDDDLLNKQFTASYGFTYGRKRVITENEFLQQVREINDKIAPTPSVSHYDRILPAIIYTDNSGQVTNKATKPRMLYYGGLEACTTYKIVENGVETNFTQYPYSGLQDDPYNPTFILTWGIPNEIFYKRYPGKDPIKMSTNDLFTNYWYNTIYSIANKDSRVVEGWFWIDSERYYNASFRDQYWFNNAYHRLLKIEDWVASSDKSLVKCTFLKLQRVDTPTIEVNTIGGGRSGNGNGDGGTSIDNQKVTDRVRYGPVSGLATGENGTDGIDGMGKMIGIINAPRVVIGDNATNSSVLGRSNNVLAGLSNVTSINSDIESPIPNVSVINNLIQKTDTIHVTSTELGTIDTTPLKLIENLIEGSSIYINSVFGLLTFDTDVYQNRDIHITNDDGDILFNFGSGFTNNAVDTIRAAEKLHPHILKRDQSIYLENNGLMTTGLGELTLIINYTILTL